MDNRYFEFMKEYPDLFVNLQGGIDVLCDKEDISKVEKLYGSEIGIIYEDQYVVFLKDAVKFPDGEIAPYIRMYHKYKGGVAILPVFKGKIILLQHFRHSLRKWLLETPRGFGEDGLSEQKNAEKELFEELGTEKFSIVKLGDIIPDAGIVGEKIALYFAQIDDNSKINLEVHEGIKKYLLLSKYEILTKISSGEIIDGITVSSVMLAMAKGFI